MIYEVRAARAQRGRATFYDMLHLSVGSGASLLLRVWKNPKHGLGSFVWEGAKGANNLKWQEVYNQNIGKGYTYASGVQDLKLPLDSLVKPGTMTGQIIGDLDEKGLRKVLAYIDAMEAVEPSADEVMTRAQTHIVALLNRMAPGAASPTPPIEQVSVTPQAVNEPMLSDEELQAALRAQMPEFGAWS